MRGAVPCVLARPQFPQPSCGSGPVRLAFAKHVRGAGSWRGRRGDQMDTAEQARQGHVSKHNRHAVGSATRNGDSGEGDRSREHQVAPAGHRMKGWAHGRTWDCSWQAGSREDLRTQPRGLQSVETGNLSFFPCCNLRKGRAHPTLTPTPRSSLCSPS